MQNVVTKDIVFSILDTAHDNTIYREKNIGKKARICFVESNNKISFKNFFECFKVSHMKNMRIWNKFYEN